MSRSKKNSDLPHLDRTMDLSPKKSQVTLPQPPNLDLQSKFKVLGEKNKPLSLLSGSLPASGNPLDGPYVNHLRWNFERTIGFPDGGFKLYRQEVGKRIWAIYFNQGGEQLRKLFGKPVPLQPLSGTIYNASFFIVLENNPLGYEWNILKDEARKISKEKIKDKFLSPYNPPSGTFDLDMTFSQKTPLVQLGAFLSKSIKVEERFIEITAFLENKEIKIVEDHQVKSKYQFPESLKLNTYLDISIEAADQNNPFIDKIKIRCCGAKFHYLKISPILEAEWKKIWPVPTSNNPNSQEDEVLHLPVSWTEAQKRLPTNIKNNPGMLAAYQAGFAESIDLLTLIKNFPGVPTAALLLNEKGQPEDLQVPIDDEENPYLTIPAVDVLYLASLDPIVAQLLGFYYVDEKLESNQEYLYKVVGNWSENTPFLLDNNFSFDHYPTNKSLQSFQPLVDPEGKVFGMIHGEFSGKIEKVEVSGQIGVYQKGLILQKLETQNEFSFFIIFTKSVEEIQLFLLKPHDPGADTFNYTIYDESAKIIKSETFHNDRVENILECHAPNIRALKLVGKALGILNIAQGQTKFGRGQYSGFSIARKLTPPLYPNHLTATQFPGITRGNDTESLDSMNKDALTKDFLNSLILVGLNWDLDLYSPGKGLKATNEKVVSTQSGSSKEALFEEKSRALKPVLFSVEKRDKGDDWKEISEYPILVPQSNELQGRDATPTGDSLPKFFFTDQVILDLTDPAIVGNNIEYRVHGKDIFGRSSAYSEPLSVTILPETVPPPPPPTNIQAQYLHEAPTPSIHLTWEWSHLLQRQSPIAQKFHVYLNPGWLNQLQGLILSVTDNGDGTSTVLTDVVIKGGIDQSLLFALYQNFNDCLNGPESNSESKSEPTYIQIAGKAYLILRGDLVSGQLIESENPTVFTQINEVLGRKITSPKGVDPKVPGIPEIDPKIAEKSTLVRESGRGGGDRSSPFSRKRFQKNAREEPPLEKIALGENQSDLSGKDVVSSQSWVPPSIDLDIGGIVSLNPLQSPPASAKQFQDLVQKGAGLKDFPSPTLPTNTLGQDSYLLALVVKNNTNTGGEVIPAQGKFSLAVFPQNPLFKDYTNSSSWSTEWGTWTVKLTPNKVGKYELDIPNIPTILLPSPQTPIVYAQFGISTASPFSEGAVSSPVTVSAVYIQAPPEPDPPGEPTQAKIFASLPDFAGHCTHQLRWKKTPGMTYEVYRARDEKVFQKDKAVRAERNALWTDEDVHTFMAKYVGWLQANAPSITPDQLDALKQELESGVVTPSSVQYSNLAKNFECQVLASLSLLDDAYTRIHDGHLAWDDPKYQDLADPNYMVYTDSTIPGQGTGRYFYRVKAIDPVGNKSEFGIASVPVHVPDTSRPQKPVITKILAGDRQATICWDASPKSKIKQYHLHRTDNEQEAFDIRLMPLVKKIPVSGKTSYQVVDKGLKGSTTYFYRLVAVREGVIGEDKTLEIKSKASSLASTWVYAYLPLKPKSVDIEPLDENQIRIQIELQEPGILVQIQRYDQSEGLNNWQIRTPWTEVGSELDGKIIWEYLDFRPSQYANYIYRFGLLSQNGVVIFFEKLDGKKFIVLGEKIDIIKEGAIGIEKKLTQNQIEGLNTGKKIKSARERFKKLFGREKRK